MGGKRNPISDELQRYKLEAAQANARANAAELIGEETGPANGMSTPKADNNKTIKRVESLEEDNKALREDNKLLSKRVEILENENEGLRACLLSLSIDMHGLALRKVLDDSREKFAKDCGYNGWQDIKTELGGVGPAKRKMSESDILRQHNWQSALGSYVDLIVDRNMFRRRGNQVAHEYDEGAITRAIEATPMGRHRKSLFIELFDFLHGPCSYQSLLSSEVWNDDE